MKLPQLPAFMAEVATLAEQIVAWSFISGVVGSVLLPLFRLCPTYAQTLGQSVVVLTMGWSKIQNDRTGEIFGRCASQFFRTMDGPTGQAV